MRRITFEWVGDEIKFNGNTLMSLVAAPDTPEREKENRDASALVKMYGGFGLMPSAMDDAGRARLEEVKAWHDKRRRERLERPRR